jgi:hypothetical protein
MNYLQCYNNLVASRQQLQRAKGQGVYFERHHIVPRWLGGKDTKDNLCSQQKNIILHIFYYGNIIEIDQVL